MWEVWKWSWGRAFTVNFISVPVWHPVDVDESENHTPLQGVPQYFGHLEICNFSASEVTKIKIVDIFEKPGQFSFRNYPYF